jgi:hypothetical protein
VEGEFGERDFGEDMQVGEFEVGGDGREEESRKKETKEETEGRRGRTHFARAQPEEEEKGPKRKKGKERKR